MVSTKENIERLKEYFRYSKQELVGIIVAIIVFGFLFSFRDWGEEQFDLMFGLKNLFLALLVVAISFFFRLSSQKIYALTQGQKAEYKVWWAGIVVSLIIGFITLLTFFFDGFIGLTILITATAIGILASSWGIGKNHLMGCLILPVILYFVL